MWKQIFDRYEVSDCGLAWNEEKRPDLMDIPARIDKDK